MKCINRLMLPAPRLLLSVMLLCVLSAEVNAEARYQVVPLHPGYEFGTEKALILDTVAGHMWIWVESPAVGDREGARLVIYQGQLTPGRDMGEVIAQQRWPASSPQ